MSSLLDNLLQIRYIKLHFTLVFPEEVSLPASKTSMLRGGIGEMLLRSCCIRERDCEHCDFSDECIVQRTMYSKFRHKPAFVTQQESVGYVIECENYQEDYLAGETLQFNLILFGRTIVYFSQYLQAITMLGQYGVGKNRARFYIQKLTNSRGEAMLDGHNIRMKYYKIEHFQDYVAYRLKMMQEVPSEIIFKTPVTIKHNGSFIKEFDMEAIVKSVQRRLYILGCFEDILDDDFYRHVFDMPMILGQEVRPVSVRRFSNRQESAMYLRGIKGKIELEAIEDEDLLKLLIIGELMHIGKNTSFGFGRYRMK